MKRDFLRNNYLLALITIFINSLLSATIISFAGSAFHVGVMYILFIVAIVWLVAYLSCRYDLASYLQLAYFLVAIFQAVVLYFLIGGAYVIVLTLNNAIGLINTVIFSENYTNFKRSYARRYAKAMSQARHAVQLYVDKPLDLPDFEKKNATTASKATKTTTTKKKISKKKTAVKKKAVKKKAVKKKSVKKKAVKKKSIKRKATKKKTLTKKIK
ncbi:MAG: hypothetical protein H6502_04255 [Candidatus Woesearchaeota archaeon]|nr:MAG: hypothetical protein H6502_04255 [Candidatus Woesearchaeota archaeon]